MEDQIFEDTVCLNGKVYVAEEVDKKGFTCSEKCAFYEKEGRFCDQIKCTPIERLDKRNVIFVEKEK